MMVETACFIAVLLLGYIAYLLWCANHALTKDKVEEEPEGFCRIPGHWRIRLGKKSWVSSHYRRRRGA